MTCQVFKWRKFGLGWSPGNTFVFLELEDGSQWAKLIGPLYAMHKPPRGYS